MSMDCVEDASTEEHAKLLATVWCPAKELQEHGVSYREGPFTETEAQQVREALVQYGEAQQISQDEVEDLIFGASSRDGFWGHIARTVPQRRVRLVYDHVRRAKHPSRNRGKWTEFEDVRLKEFVEEGLNWSKVGDAMNRPSADCCYRFEVYLHVADTQRQGPWTEDEQARLNQIMLDLAEHGKTPGKLSKFWVEVSERMDKTRSPKQCSNKWNSSLPRWRAIDSKLLVRKVARLDLDREDDIRWDELVDARWNKLTGAKLQERWLALRKTVHSPDATHRDVVQRLTSQFSTQRASKSS